MNKKLIFTVQKTALVFVVTISLFFCSRHVINQKTSLDSLIKADKEWEEAVALNDPVKVTSFYDSGGFAISGVKIIKGRVALQNYWKYWTGVPGFKLTWEVQDARISGDLGYTYGPWKLKFMQDGKPIENEGIYLATWRKQENGDWKVLVDKP